MGWKLSTWLTVAVLCVVALSVSGDFRENFPGYPYAKYAVPDGPIINPYPKAVRAELYATEWASKDGELTIKREWRRPLSAGQLARIEANIVRRQDHREAVAACCVPHHSIRYYNAAGKQVGEIAICFCCGCVESQPILAQTEQQYIDFNREELKLIFNGLGVPTDIDCWKPPAD